MRTEVEDMRSSGSTVISATDVLAAYNGHERRGRPPLFLLGRRHHRMGRTPAR